MRSRYDVAIIGAGPAGTVAAIAHAKRGARVLLAEAKPGAAARFAGEWLHPPGASVLEELGLLPIEAATGHGRGCGMVVFPDDGEEPIRLPYPDGPTGLSFEHQAFVEALRERADALDNVDYLPGSRVVHIQPGRLTLRSPTDGISEVATDRIVGAEGRNSVSRTHLGLSNDTMRLSRMAGVELRGVRLPFEGYGHVVVGGPGPILMYRIGADRIRACLDLPLDRCPRRVDATLLWRSFRHVMPPTLLPAFREALLHGRVMWTTTRMRPRSHYGSGDVALIGDAAGFFHPLTAAGMTLGLHDAVTLARSRNPEEYRRQRERQFFVAELLSTALYHVLSREDASADSIRTAVYRMWGASELERQRTMRMLITEDYRSVSFAAAFLKVGIGAVKHLVRVDSHRDLRRPLTALAGALSVPQTMIRWPAALLMRRLARSPFQSAGMQAAIPQLRLVTPSDPPDEPTATPSPNEIDVRGALASVFGALTDFIEHPPADERRDLPRAIETLSRARVQLGDGPEISTALASGARLLSAAPDSPGPARNPAERLTLETCIALVADPAAGDRSLGELRRLTRNVLDAQCKGGSFHAPGGSGGRWLGLIRDGRRDDVATTALCCRALTAIRRRHPRLLIDRVPIAIARARTWLEKAQTSAGCWLVAGGRPGVDLTASVTEALFLAGTPATARPLRRAGRWLREAQTPAGTWIERGIPSAPLTAHVVHALIAARPLECEAIERGVNALLEPTAWNAGANPTTRNLCEIGEGLTSYLEWNGDVPGSDALRRRDLEA